MTTMPFCTMTDGMDSKTIIPSSEINVSDKMAVVDDLRPQSSTPLQSSDGQLIIEYNPTVTRPIKAVELVSTENIKTYNVTFYNVDGTVTTKKVSNRQLCEVSLSLLCLDCSIQVVGFYIEINKSPNSSLTFLTFDIFTFSNKIDAVEKYV